MGELFTDKSGLEGVVIDEALGGITGAAGRYVFNKFIGAPLAGALKSAGKYADTAAALVYGAALNYFGRDRDGLMGNGLRVAGYVPLADQIAKMFGDPSLGSVAPAHSSSSSNPWGSLAPVQITHGQELSY